MIDENDIVRAKESIKSQWLGRPGITGIDIGVKYKGGKPTGEVAIRLMVKKKLTGLSPSDTFPAAIGVHPTDIIEREFKLANGVKTGSAAPPDSARQDAQDMTLYNPMLGGVRLFITGAASTAGMFVTDNKTGALMLLGTFHMTGNIGDRVYQPDTGDITTEVMLPVIGNISRRAATLTPAMDADLFSYTAPRGVEFKIQDLGPVTGVRTVTLNDLKNVENQMGFHVRKRGIRTLVTEGYFEGIFGSFMVTLDDGKIYQLENLLSFNLLLNNGDSGAIALDDSGKAVAILTLIYQKGNVVISAGSMITALMETLDFTPCVYGQATPKHTPGGSVQPPVPPPR